GVVATAIPTPSATANPPTRPMYLVLRMMIPPRFICGLQTSQTAISCRDDIVARARRVELSNQLLESLLVAMRHYLSPGLWLRRPISDRTSFRSGDGFSAMMGRRSGTRQGRAKGAGGAGGA